MIDRRKLITGLISFAVAPAIVKIENIMPVKVYSDPQEILNALINNISMRTITEYHVDGSVTFKYEDIIFQRILPRPEWLYT